MTDAEVNQINEQRLSGVKPVLAQAATRIIEAARRAGYVLIVAEGFRTVAQQNIYYAQGRTAPGKIITYTKGNEGKHTRGEAVDFDFVVGGVQSNSLSNNWAIVGQLAKSLGLVWGGDWINLRDYRHIEMPNNYILPVVDLNSSIPVAAGLTIGTAVVLVLLLIAISD
jgi:peptidoglycan L-alanyl-D-glutamate endopeptidase CwlK